MYIGALFLDRNLSRFIDYVQQINNKVDLLTKTAAQVAIIIIIKCF